MTRLEVLSDHKAYPPFFTLAQALFESGFGRRVRQHHVTRPLLPNDALEQRGITEKGHAPVKGLSTILGKPGDRLKSKWAAICKHPAQRFDLGSAPHQNGPVMVAHRKKNGSQPTRQRPVGTHEQR